jgi:hypothetical protein
LTKKTPDKPGVFLSLKTFAPWDILGMLQGGNSMMPLARGFGAIQFTLEKE